MPKPKTNKSVSASERSARATKGRATALANAQRERETFRAIALQSETAEQAHDREVADAAVREANARLEAAGFDVAELRRAR